MSFDIAASPSGWTRRCGALAALQLIAFALFCVVLAVPAAQAQIRAKADAEEFSRYGRLILTFDRLPDYKLRVNSGVLVLEFGEAVQLDTSKLTSDLRNYLAAARLDPDGGAMRLALSQIATVNTMEAGDQLFIDFLPEGWTGLPPSLPQDVIARLAQRAKQAEEAAKLQALRDAGLVDMPRVSLSIGQTETFTRLEFGWDRRVEAKVTRDLKTVQIQFNTSGTVDLAELRALQPRFVSGAQSDVNLEGMLVTLDVDRAAGVRAFADGKRYTVDISGGPGALAGDTNLRTVAPGLDGSGPIDENAQLATDLPGDDQARRAASDAAQAKAPPLEVTSEAFLPDQYSVRDFGDWTPPPAESAPGGGVRVGDLGETDRGDIGNPSAAAAPAQGAAVESVAVSAERIGQSVRLTFPFPEKVAAAIFNRAGTVWMVFDSDIPIDLGNIKNDLNDRASDITLTRSGDMQYLRVKLLRPELTTAAAEASLWVVTIGDMILEPSKPLALRRRLGNDGQSLVAVDLPEAGRVHWLRDPELGDDLAVVTARGAPRGLLKPQDFVEFVAFPSAHGLALRSLADDLRVTLLIDEVVISRNGGLWLSAGGAQQYAPGRRETGNLRKPGFVNFAGITHSGRTKFIDSRQQLELQAAVAEGEERLPAEMTLARFYIGFHLAAEALGLLQTIEEREPSIVNDPSFVALRGIANVMMGRSDLARKDFAVHGLSQSKDISLWNGLVELDARNWRAAQLAIKDGEDALDDYPIDMQARFRLAGARAAIEVKDLADASYHLERLNDLSALPDLAAQTLLLQARLYEVQGRMDEAFARYAVAKASTVRPVVAEATMREIALLQRMRQIKDDDALDRLETLEVAWRGDDIELETLKMLAELNARKGNYRRAFDIMRTATSIKPDADLTRHIQDYAASVFRDLFLNGAAEKLSPVDALALYYDFRDLTPVGRLGDDMIRRLADRLVDVDLLDQAAELLSYQIENRLRGAARAQVAGNLATIYLAARQPAKAVNILQRTRIAGLPGALQRQRNLLEARALSETGRTDLALELLDTMQGDDAEKLKADTLWQGQRWQEMAEQLERTLGGVWSASNSALSAEERQNVMRAAIGYSMAKDQVGLDRLHTKFASKMSEGPDAQAFQVVTAPIQAQGEEFLTLARSIASVDTLEAFLDEMRTRYRAAATPESTSESIPESPAAPPS